MSAKKKIYRGLRASDAGPCTVTVNGVLLDARFDLRNHSPAGFQWGYGGSGPAQLALALLADALEDDELAQRWYQPYKARVVARLATDAWELSADGIRAIVEALKIEEEGPQGPVCDYGKEELASMDREQLERFVVAAGVYFDQLIAELGRMAHLARELPPGYEHWQVQLLQLRRQADRVLCDL